MEHIHFVGIGGYGMSGIARVLLELGYEVSGSDLQDSDRIEGLRRAGAEVHIGHDRSHVGEADRVVYSTDVPTHNEEIAAARAAGVQVAHRSEVLAELLNERFGIAVTGTHGKTTTSGMISYVLQQAGLDPTLLIGGDVAQLGGNARLGSGPHLVAEACESDGSFLRYRPRIGVVTNVEPEHLDHYDGDFDKMVAAVRQFIDGVRRGGCAVLSWDDAHLRRLAAQVSTPVVRFGFHEAAEVRAADLDSHDQGIDFDLHLPGAGPRRVALQLPGRHNVSNALAAAAVAGELAMDMDQVVEALESFAGAKRRFQVLTERPVTVVDDYAHHPTEIKATIRAAREQTDRRVVAVFQPQRYQRTQLLMDEFAGAFGGADDVILETIYSPPGETPIPGVSSEVLATRITEREGHDVPVFERHGELVHHLLQVVDEGDVVVLMGAGDIWRAAYQLAETLEDGRRVS